MAGRNERSDTRLNVARYQLDGSVPSDAEPDDEADVAGQTRMEARAQYVEIQIQQAIRAGAFDNLPGAGKPLTGLEQTYDPDWWIRKKIERENITGLGPPALTLRTENQGLDARLDAAPSEHAVRQLLDDFNARIVKARRQLKGGPPVITPVRDVDDEVARWRQRRTARLEAAHAAREQREAELAAMTWRERRRARREEGL
ncbi:J-domain-containing protein [Subtercola sp. YIM 133946]|uniref:DnaJ family domain-containing protein n=1 Tax=Subtercola sp. YIM 133946 TaxID=3118909 RepID=UPI002F959BFD